MNPSAAILLDSPFGELYLAASDAALTDLRFAATDATRPVPPSRAPGGPAGAILVRVATQLAEYAAGGRHDFDLPVDPAGTPFQQTVWLALRTIPYGETLSYGELARRIGRPRAVRAVGAANGRNPISIVLPCHRVIGADGSLTGYGGGLAVKETLLELERG